MKRLAVLCLLFACEKPAEKPIDKPVERPPAVIRVAAASDLTRAFEDMGSAFERDQKQHVELSYGSSGLLQKQIAAGAPFDLFASANAAFVDALIESKDCLSDSRASYAVGHLVVWSKPGSVAPAEKLEDLADARFKKVAIGNPESAPYGKAAKQALIKVGVWDKLEPKLVIGENVRQTMQYAESGNVEAALVSLSLAVDAPPYLLVDAGAYAPIDQTLVVCRHGSNQAGGRAFGNYVNSPAGRAIMRRYGLMLPGESLAQAK
jgi:molybdate transport system substrate-binding protein